MRILYLSRLAFGSEKANVYNTIRTCEALAEAGAQVTLVSTDDGASTPEDLSKFKTKFAVRDTFTIVSLQGRSNRYKFGAKRQRSKYATLLANLELIGEARRRRSSCDVIYMREALLLPAALYCTWVLRKPVFFEAHAVLVGARNKFLGDRLARTSRGVIAITHGLAEYYRAFNTNVIVSYCAAAEPERFVRIKLNKRELREKLGIPTDKHLLTYTGNLVRTGNNDSYGVEDIIAALPHMPEDTVFVGVGKKNLEETKELEDLTAKLGVTERVMLMPWTTKDTVAEYVLASDQLLIPAAGARIGNAPTKMFDYLVSGIPIVAADTKPIREVLTDRRTALLVDYKDPSAWAKAVAEIRDDANLRTSLIAQAKREGAQYTWEKRGRDILAFLERSMRL